MRKAVDSTISEKIATDDKLRKQIKESQRNSIICFIDLSNSTALKLKKDPIDWLSDEYQFLHLVEDAVRNNSGRVIKRIGDEVMAEFDAIADSEFFLKEIINDARLDKYDFKIGIDSGSVYYFDFDKKQHHDPYGPIVDRCARLVGLAKGSVIFCSKDYYELVTTPNDYQKLGTFPLKGIIGQIDIFFRIGFREIHDDYVQELVSILDKHPSMSGYKSISRQFTADYFRKQVTLSAHPFLLSALINVPKTNKSIKELINIFRSDESMKPQYLGYLISDEGYFRRYRVLEKTGFSDAQILVFLSCDIEKNSDGPVLALPENYLEEVKSFFLGQSIAFSGIIVDTNSLSIHIDYVELH